MALCWGPHCSVLAWAFVTFALMCNFTFIATCGVGKGSYAKKNYPPFSKYQQKPEEDEESAVASGRFSHKIKYGSPEFKSKIVRYFGTNVVFSDDEGTGADRYMTRQCEKALQRLAQQVRVKWSNKVKVRVIEAWDEDGEHYSRSLHYEGRAIDITTSDRDRSKLGALASLAYFKAEFDWVTFLDGHVHVSCKKDDAVDERNSCFSARSTVLTEHGITKTMDTLEIGDRVLTQTASGDLVFSRVVMFMDSKPTAIINSYVTVETEISSLELTKKHIIFVSKDRMKFEAVFAERVEPGDYIKVLNSNKTKLIEARVTKVQVRSSIGAFAPLTEEGTLLVNGVLVSCYALTEDLNTAHLSFLPWRYTYEILKHFAGSKPQTGLHWYVRVLRTINSVLGILPDV